MKLHLLALSALVLVGVATAGATHLPIFRDDREAEYTRHLVNQYHCVQVRDTNGAIAEDTAMIELFPNRAVPYLFRGMAHDAETRHSLAVADFTASLDRLPLDRDIQRETRGCTSTNACMLKISESLYYNRGVQYEAMGKHQVALDDLNQALATSPGMPEAHQVRAEAELALKKSRDCIAACDWAIAHGEPPVDKTYFIRGQANAGAGDFATAAKDLQSATVLRTDVDWLFRYQGRYQYKAGGIIDAISSLEKAVRDGDDSAKAQYYLGICYVMIGREAEAAESYRAGRLRQEPADLKEARQDIDDALRTHPGHALLLKARNWLAAD